jgi:succinate dehydrogenase / fumarate reductase flavoprotein subunit
MSESLRNDGRLWVPLHAGDDRRPEAIPETERDYFLERRYPRFGNLVPRDLGTRACKALCDDGRGVGPGGRGVYLDLTEAAGRLGGDVLRERYGNLFEMYTRITGDDPLHGAMRIAPAAHYSMGGLWVDYDLMSTIPGLFVIGEANFSDQGANRLGASGLMQGRPTATSSCLTLWPATSTGPDWPRSPRTARRRGGRWRTRGRVWVGCSARPAGAPPPTSTARWAA